MYHLSPIDVTGADRRADPLGIREKGRLMGIPIDVSGECPRDDRAGSFEGRATTLGLR